MRETSRRIMRLPPEVASQIAAGEVIQRPASVVKELVENAIDAGAQRIQVEIEDGGAFRIRVSDDGSGMSADDAKMALERFCTSKVNDLHDLFNIKSLGFRGEALPSIASCSKVTIDTNVENSLVGTSLYVEGGSIVRMEEKGLPPGTTVTVLDLFYNTPARLKFMKSRAREDDVIMDTVLRLALSFPERRFALVFDGKIVLNTSGNGLFSAISDIYGPEVGKALVPLDYKTEDGTIRVKGYAGLPSLYRRQRDRIFLSCNARPIRSASLNWSIDAAYLGLLPPKTYPFSVINVEIPFSAVDVNVHPQKTEVKFRDEEKVKKAVTFAVRMGLSEKGFRVDVPKGQVEMSDNSASSVPTRKEREIPPFGGYEEKTLRQPPCSYLRIKDKGSHYDENPKMLPDKEKEWEYLGSFRDTYLIVKTESSIVIIDKHALAESLNYEALVTGKSGSQELLMPEITKLDPREARFFHENEEVFARMGFDVRAVGEMTVLVSKVPVIRGQSLPPDSLSQVISELLSKTKSQEKIGNSTERYLLDGFLALASCHSSVRSQEPMSRQEAEELIREYFAGTSQRTCPHGRPCVYEIPLDEIKRFFGR